MGGFLVSQSGLDLAQFSEEVPLPLSTCLPIAKKDKKGKISALSFED